MKVSYNWLRKILKFSESPQEISDILTSTGLGGRRHQGILFKF